MTDELAQLRAIAGIPDDLPADSSPAETVAHLADQAAEVLERITPPRFRGPIQLEARVSNWVDAFVADPGGAGSLLLVGVTGCGKTHHGYAALRGAVLGSYARSVRPTYRAVSYPDFVANTRPAYDDSHLDALERYTHCRLLFMDDLGADTKTTDWSNTTLFRLVNARWENDRPTIWTTNRNQTELAAVLGDRIVSRIWESRRIVLTGPDRRRVSA